MTSSCLDQSVLHWDPRSGSVARFLGLGKASLAWEWDILGWVGWPAGHLLGNRPFVPKKRHFWSRVDHYPRFFGHFLTSARAWPSLTLLKTGLNLNPVEGEIRHVIESTSFPSKTGVQRPQRPPGGPPGGVWIIIYNFSKFLLASPLCR